MTNETILYYQQNAKNFSESTYDLQMDDMWNRFTTLLSPNSKILDAGCGSCRDSNYFIGIGHTVISIDPVSEFNDFALNQFGITIQNLSFQEIDYNKEFDAIWACASLLHVPFNEMNSVFLKLHKSLKNFGIMYCSFKYGDIEKMNNGRLFSYFNESSFTSFLSKNNLFSIVEMWTTLDVRPNREDEKWLNVLLKKNNF